MNSWFSGLFLGVIVCCGVGCASSAPQQRRDVARFENSLADLRNFQAEQTTQITALNSELRGLVGRIEKLELAQQSQPLPQPFGPSGIDQGTGGTAVSVQPALPGNNLQPGQQPPPPIVPVAALESDQRMAATLGREVAIPFGEALFRLQEGRFEEAIPLLRNALDSSGTNIWVANLHFWLGVAHDGLGDNPGALGAYNTVVTQFPKHDRAALALFRQAQVFIRLRDTTAAGLTFRKLIAEYPNTEEARIARDRLKDL